jgi:hypothetical protein
MTKSYVTMEQAACLVCCKTFETGNLLLDKRLRERFDMHTLTGWGLCDDCTPMHEQGYIAIVGCDPEKSTAEPDGSILPENAHRTGEVAHLRIEAWDTCFNIPLPKEPAVFATQDVVDWLKEQMELAEGREQT